MGEKDSNDIIFVVDSSYIYNALLGRNWIHLNSCIPSSLHQMLILWNTTHNGEKEVDIVKADVKPFVTNSNKFEAHFYDEGIGTLRLIGNRMICQGQNYCMTETSLKSIE